MKFATLIGLLAFLLHPHPDADTIHGTINADVSFTCPNVVTENYILVEYNAADCCEFIIQIDGQQYRRNARPDMPPDLFQFQGTAGVHTIQTGGNTYEFILYNHNYKPKKQAR